MLAVEFFLAASLLLAPLDSPPPDQRLFDTLRLPLQLLAIEWEILDPREASYMLMRAEDFASDMETIRGRVSDLADAPFSHESMRFPDREAVNEFMAFNRAYRDQLEIIQAGWPIRWWQAQEAIDKTDRLYLIWDTVRDARCEYYYVTTRRQALNKLRDMVGERAYYTGDLPMYVPVERFVPIRK